MEDSGLLGSGLPAALRLAALHGSPPQLCKLLGLRMRPYVELVWVIQGHGVQVHSREKGTVRPGDMNWTRVAGELAGQRTR